MRFNHYRQIGQPMGYSLILIVVIVNGLRNSSFRTVPLLWWGNIKPFQRGPARSDGFATWARPPVNILRGDIWIIGPVLRISSKEFYSSRRIFIF